MKLTRSLHPGGRSWLALLACLAACASPPAPRETAPIESAPPLGESDQALSAERTCVDLAYKLYLPPSYVAAADRPRWPLLVFLHGAGERGDDLERVAIHGPIGIARQRDMPFVIVSPLCPKGRAWRNEELLALIEDCLARYHVDPDRVLLTGLSMGGYGTFQLGLAHPQLFAALVPICGGGETLTPRMHDEAGMTALRSLPVRVYHGVDDKVVSIEESLRMVGLLERLGVPVQMIRYEGVGHAAWKPAYQDKELWTWLAAQRRL